MLHYIYHMTLKLLKNLKIAFWREHIKILSSFTQPLRNVIKSVNH